MPVIRVPYKVYPAGHWAPILNVRIIFKHASSKRVEALVDSGAPTCFFHGTIGKALGMSVESATEGPLDGIIGGIIRKVYYHDIKIEFLVKWFH